jgi:hypothetical protein
MKTMDGKLQILGSTISSKNSLPEAKTMNTENGDTKITTSPLGSVTRFRKLICYS